ncbi:peptidylprolyl isomerase [Henriciella sp.]|uniref:peptidylprolyl isomerase n=1 Tax=Henriciella sp. TaxID=1968823 RepID=UPI00262997D9|nr:peptidylprolyl isomerase [Henriciella sp.]
MKLIGRIMMGAAVACMAAIPAGFAQEEASDWRAVAPENLLLIDTGKGRITIELNPDFAPGHVDRIRELAEAGVLDGETFYRVIDGFVAQGGLNEEGAVDAWPALENENDRPYGGEDFIELGNRDLFAPEVGHIDGFAVGRNQLLQEEWLLHCPGAVAMARDTGPDTAATEFYIVLDAQRYLDRNLTVFGRVIDGMKNVQALKRGDREIENGVIQAPDEGDEIIDFYMASSLPEDERPQWEVMETNSIAFEDFKVAKRIRNEEFFYRQPPQVLDICSFSVPARQAGEGG